MPLPPRSPELSPTENVWQYMRQNWLSNRVFKTYHDILALSAEAWNKLTHRPWTIISIGSPAALGRGPRPGRPREDTPGCHNPTRDERQSRRADRSESDLMPILRPMTSY
jgi:hypothetical protein